MAVPFVKRAGLEAVCEVLIGDSRRWTCKLSNKLFPDATKIVDAYFARDRISWVSKAACGAGTDWHKT